MSRARIREFLWEWMGLSLSVGTISQTIHEAGAAVAPAEDDCMDAATVFGVKRRSGIRPTVCQI
jgi:hypothetical protein